MRHLIKSVFLALVLVSFSLIGKAQVSQITIKAQIIDENDEIVPAATVMLLNSKDSTLINYTTSDSQGNFSFKNVKNSGYLLKISHVSFMPVQKNIPISNQATVDLGIIKLEPIAEILMEVVIKSAQAPIFIKGDTVEYDARLFKVPPGSTVEDLLKRLPGIDVDVSGNISSQGKDIRRVYVDGKTFFGDDPKSATKNLDAQAISKVQVYDDKSEQERLTGIADGNKEKVMNLELKDEFKKGHFGKATLAGGFDDYRKKLLWASKANFNRFNEKHQLSIIGFGNNVNQTGVNWDDYSEFKGSAAFSNRDNGDFGFGGDGSGFHVMEIGGGGIMGYFDGKGFTKNYGGGVNYNYNTKKINFNASYSYNQTDLNSETFANRQTFLTDTSYLLNTNSASDVFRNSHNISSRIEHNIDSSNTLIFKIYGRFSGNRSIDTRTQLFKTILDQNINKNFTNETDTLDSKVINTLAIYNHSFKKRGRKFAISGAFNYYQSGRMENLINKNEFFSATTELEQINILNSKDNDDNTIKSSVLYVEPLSKRFSIFGFYNFRNYSTQSKNLGTDALTNYIMVDSLSIYYQNKEMFNRVGTSINYNWEGLNISLGGAFQSINLFNKYSVTENSPLLVPELTKTYNNFIPNFTTYYEFPNNLHINLGYSYDINVPSISYLQPIPNLSNRFYKTEGNPDLEPESYHSTDISWTYWNQASFTNIHASAYYYYYDSQIVYNQETKFVEGLGYTTIMKPENLSGGQSVTAYLWSSMPIVKTILTLRLGGSYSYRESPVYINSIRNTTNTNSYRLNLGFNLTLSSKLSLSLGSSGSLSDVSYSIQTSQNQNIINLSASTGIKWQFAKKSFFEANYDFTKYQNDRFELNEVLHLANASIRQILGKNNKFELRLAVFDLLNQNKMISQTPGSNYIETSISPTLARYYMLSVSYNIKGFETKKKQMWW